MGKLCGFWVPIFICLSGTFCTSAKRLLSALCMPAECGPRLFMLTALLVFLHLLLLPWACLFYCFLKLDVASYFVSEDLCMSKQKPICVFFPLLSLDGDLRARAPENAPLTWYYSSSSTAYQCGCNYLIQIPPACGYVGMTSLDSDYIHFFWVCLCTFCLCQSRLGLNGKILSKTDVETVNKVVK